MIFVNYEEDSFNEYWELLTQNDFISPFYQKKQQQYTAQRPKDEGSNCKNISFIMLLDRKPVAGFIGATVEQEGVVKVLAYEMPALFVEDRSVFTKKAKQKFAKEFDRRIKGSHYLYLTDYLPQGVISTLSTHLLKTGAKPTPRLSQVIDLMYDKALLRGRVRKSYSSLINNGLRDLMPEVVDSKTINWEMMLIFRALHIREAGGETRSEESWRRQYEMIQADEAFAIFGTIDNQVVTAGLFSYNKTNCYYWVSASRRDLFDKPLFHAIMWIAILRAKELGCKWFEVGEQYFLNHPEGAQPTKKELGISDFKAGFGGQTRVFLDVKYSNDK